MGGKVVLKVNEWAEWLWLSLAVGRTGTAKLVVDWGLETWDLG